MQVTGSRVTGSGRCAVQHGRARRLGALMAVVLVAGVAACTSGAPGPDDGASSAPPSASVTGPSRAGVEQLPDGSLQTHSLPAEGSWPTRQATISDATRREQEARRPTLRLPRGNGWVSLDADRLGDELWDAVTYTGPHGPGFVPSVAAAALNTEVPVDFSKPHNLLSCEEPDVAPGLTDVRVLRNEVVAFPDGPRCVGETEYVVEGHRVRESLQLWPVGNRLGNQALVQ